MQLKRIKVTLEDKNDYSNASQEERAAALTEMEQECINRIVQGILAQGLIQYELEETPVHGYRATATLGVYDIRAMAGVPEEAEKERQKAGKKTSGKKKVMN